MVFRGSDHSERDSLLSPTARIRAAKTRSERLTGSILYAWALLVLLAAATTALSIYFQRQLRTLSSQLSVEHDTVQRLSQLLGVHETVIERFNASVTNTDVLTRLSTLEHNFTSTANKIKSELFDVQREISAQLNSTLQELSTTVSKAEQDISDEVRKVKADVDQYVVNTQAQFSMENSFMVYQLAGTFTLLSCLISMWHMTAHLRKMHQPDVQRKILAILWMSPIYAITSWFSLVFHSAEGYLAIIKDGYEAYIIYQFLAFCIAVLGKGNRSAVVDLLSTHVDHLTPPFRLFGCFELCGCCVPEPYDSPRALADAILLQCQVFALQFVFFRPFTTTGMVVLKQLKYYGGGDGPMDYRAPQFYLTIIQNVSIFVAFTGLLKFYHAVDQELAWCRPFAKFLCIKGVVFMTFWQGLAISVLADVTEMGGADAEAWAKSAQNFLICLEMLLFSIAHFYCFPTEEWQEGYRVKHSRGAFGDSIALGDFFQDLKLILRYVLEGRLHQPLYHNHNPPPLLPFSSSNSSGVKKKLKKEPDQPTIPECEESEGCDDDEDTTAISVATSFNTQEEIDTERAVAEALEESLGLAADDPDIIEAKKRLLESKVLSPEFFDLTDAPPYDLSDDDENDHGISALERHQEISSVDRGTQEKEVSDVETGTVQGPTETTRLVASDSGSSFADVLRPSIFTTVASIAERQRHSGTE